MKSAFTALTLAAALVLTQGAAAPAEAKNGRHVAAGIAIGVGLGVLGAVAASQAHASPRYYGSSVYVSRRDNRCYAWRVECREGFERSCWKYDTRC